MHPKSYLAPLTALLLAAITPPSPSHGAPAPPPIPMKATFNGIAGNGTTCQIYGDGSDYINGIDGVQCTVGQNQGDFTLDTRTKHGPARLITYSIPASSVIPSSPLRPTNPPAIPIPTYASVPAYVYVQNVLGVHAGDGWQERVAVLLPDSFGTLGYSPVFRGGNCSTYVWVKALDDGSGWEISTNPGVMSAHDISVLYQNARTTPLPVQYQHLPFDLTIRRS